MPGFVITGNEVGSSPPAAVETARAHRWEIKYVPGTGPIDESMWPRYLALYAVSVTRPIIEYDRVVIHRRGTEIYLPGKKRTNTCTIKVYEPLIPDDTDATADMFRQWWDQVVGMGGLHAFRSLNDNMNSIKRQLRTVLLDGAGNPVWTYLLSGAFPIKVEPTELDYSSSELSNLAITLSIDAFREGRDI